MALSRASTSGIRANGIGVAAGLLLSYVQVVILGRYLAFEQLGRVAIVLIVVGLVEALGDLGLSGAIIHRRETGRYRLSTLFWIQTVSGAAAALAIAASAPFIAAMAGDPRLSTLIAFSALGFPLAGIAVVWRALLLRELRFRTVAAIEVVEVALRVTTTSVLAVAGFGAMAVVWGQVGGIALRGILVVTAGWRLFRPRFHFRRTDLHGYIDFGVWQLASRALGFAAFRIDQVIIGAMLGGEALGAWYFAQSLVVRLREAVNVAVTKVAFPVLARLQDDVRALRSEFLGILELVLALNAPILLGLAALAPRWLVPIFGERWSGTEPLLQAVALLAALRALRNPSGVLALARGRARLVFGFSLGFLAVDALLVMTGVEIGGLLGGALALVLGKVLSLPVIYHLGIRPLIGPCGRSWSTAVLRPLSVALAMALLVQAFDRFIPTSFVWLPFEVAFGVAVYSGLSWWFQREALLGAVHILRPGRRVEVGLVRRLETAMEKREESGSVKLDSGGRGR